MNVRRIAALLLVLGLFTTHVAVLRAQSAAVAEPTTALALPAADANVPGVGPIRHEDWFIKTWDKREADFAAHAAEQHGALVFLGDSITQGWNDDFRGDFAGVKTANRGLSGDTTRGLLIRLEHDVLSLDPTGIVLLIGTNDIDVGVSPEDIAANVKLLLEKIAAHDPNTPVILCQVMPTSATKNRPTDKIRALNAALIAAVRGNLQVTVLDTYTLFANAEGDAKPEEFPDLLHPNGIGYAKWKAALWPLLATLGFVDREADNFKPEEGYELLFNGRDLTGWGFRASTDKERADYEKWKKDESKQPAHTLVEAPVSFDGQKASPNGRYRAINGRLVVTTPTEGRRIEKLSTNADFTGDFTLKLDFRAAPNADSGVFLHDKQLQCRDYPLAGPYKNLKNYKPQDWNELVVEAKGGKARCTCNGEVIEEAYEIPATGPFGLEGDRGQMEYRHIQIKRGS